MFHRTFLTAVMAILVIASPALAGEGSFTGASGHKTSGTVSVTKENGTITIKLDESFSLDSAPDAYVALGNASKPTDGGILEKLESWTGRAGRGIGSDHLVQEVRGPTWSRQNPQLTIG